ncbi:hypothetical protein VNO77_34471 [Canavalia gladiata]|uniref:Uncharacterized protein n=1 Tax=Canavalia gladiata TaxID=3824 RepID=A0AAN9PZT8_CANGL
MGAQEHLYLGSVIGIHGMYSRKSSVGYRATPSISNCYQQKWIEVGQEISLQGYLSNEFLTRWMVCTLESFVAFANSCQYEILVPLPLTSLFDPLDLHVDEIKGRDCDRMHPFLIPICTYWSGALVVPGQCEGFIGLFLGSKRIPLRSSIAGAIVFYPPELKKLQKDRSRSPLQLKFLTNALFRSIIPNYPWCYLALDRETEGRNVHAPRTLLN